MTAGEKRAEQAARSRIRAEMTHAFGDRAAYRCNLYHRSDGWYYQLHSSSHMEHLGRTLGQVTTHIRDLAIANRDADRYDNWH